MQIRTTYYIEEIDKELTCRIDYSCSPAEPEVGLFEDEYIIDGVEVILSESPAHYGKWVSIYEYDESWALEKAVEHHTELKRDHEEYEADLEYDRQRERRLQ